MSTQAIKDHHLEKSAHIYLRQSTMGQVRHHRESTERQYALRNKAMEMGWRADRIRTIDQDLGLSGTSMSNRDGFKTLVADVSMNQVGAVFAIEASRLSRSCTDWHRLLEICALTDTLIIDEDGCYNPSDFNDQLILGLKGTMSQAELHFIRARLQGGKLNKARKGLLRCPLPVGFVYGDESAIVLDPDQEIQNAIRLVFDTFRQTGSAYAVVQRIANLSLAFPKRAYGGAWKGKVLWGRLTSTRVLGILKNPSYAGTYVYGRYCYKKRLSAEGKIHAKMQCLPMASWQVTLRNHHEAYIGWDEFLKNRRLLQHNQTSGKDNQGPGAAREGHALLQGLLICGACGNKVHPRYTGNGGIKATYECNWKKREALSKRGCLSVTAHILDQAISQRIILAIAPSQLQVALEALKELEQRTSLVKRQWEMRVERAEYEVHLAQRRYEDVDSSNRLVAGTLEKRWNDALAAQEQLQCEYSHFQQSEALTVTAEQRELIMALGQDLPKLWQASTTQDKDRKRILRLLIKDIVVRDMPETRQVVLQIRWQGGATEEIKVTRGLRAPDMTRYGSVIVDRVKELAKTLPDGGIADALNKEGFKNSKQGALNKSMVSWIRYAHHIRPADLKPPGMLDVRGVATRLGVSTHVVYYWINRGHLSATQPGKGSRWAIALTAEKESELRDWTARSVRINHALQSSA